MIVGECDKVGTRLRCRVGRAGRQLLLFGEELSAECGDVVTPFHHALHLVGKVHRLRGVEVLGERAIHFVGRDLQIFFALAIGATARCGVFARQPRAA